MPEHVAEVRFEDAAEEARFHRLRPVDAAGPDYLAHGAKVAHEVALPVIASGGYGTTAAAIDAGIRRVLGSVCADAGKDNAFTDDEAFLFCLGFKAVAVPARDAVLALVDAAAAAEKATVALNGATAALDRLTRLAAASPASHVLAVAPAPARRPLRPEDFGCLPGLPR